MKVSSMNESENLESGMEGPNVICSANIFVIKLLQILEQNIVPHLSVGLNIWSIVTQVKQTKLI